MNHQLFVQNSKDKIKKSKTKKPSIYIKLILSLKMTSYHICNSNLPIDNQPFRFPFKIVIKMHASN